MDTIADIARKIGKKKTIELLVNQLNISKERAEFIYSIEIGKIKGDLIEANDRPDKD